MRILLLALFMPLAALAQTATPAAPTTSGPRVSHAPFRGNATVQPPPTALDLQINALQTALQATQPTPAPTAVNEQGLTVIEQSLLRQGAQQIRQLLMEAKRAEAAGNTAVAAREVALATSLTADLQTYLAAAKPK